MSKFSAANYQDYLNSLTELNPDERNFTPIESLELDGVSCNYSKVYILIDNSGSTSGNMGAMYGFSRRGGLRGRSEVLTPEVQPESQPEVKKTKHISLAEYEAASLVLSYLSKLNFTSPGVSLKISGFSSNVQNGLEVEIRGLFEFADIAENLPNIMPYPEFHGTSLSPSLSEITEIDNSLLVIITDGRISDIELTSEVLTSFRQQLEENRKTLDIITIGAGSISVGIEAERPIRADVLCGRQLRERFTRASSSTSMHLSECNIEYLESLSLFKTTFGKSTYSGAYGDYSDLNRKLQCFFTGVDCDLLLLFRHVKDGEYILASEDEKFNYSVFIDSELDGMEFQTSTLVKRGNSILRIKDGSESSYLCIPQSLVSITRLNNGRFQLSSDVQQYKELIIGSKSLYVESNEPNIFWKGRDYQRDLMNYYEDSPPGEYIYFFDDLYFEIRKINNCEYIVTNVIGEVRRYFYGSLDEIHVEMRGDGEYAVYPVN